MHDKTIRRRRAVLLLLVVISLILLTDYFGESPNSPLHSVQRGIVAVLSPVQDGASKVLSPVRDFTHWVSTTLNAKSQNAKLVAQNEKYRQEITDLDYWQTQYARDQKLLGLDQSANLKNYGLVGAQVEAYNPSYWYETIQVDKGSSAGVHMYDPVVSGAGLVGDVTFVGPDYSVVTLVTSPKYAVGAMPANSPESAGVLQPAVGNEGTLVLSLQSNAQGVEQNEVVVTSGFLDCSEPAIKSYYPPGIPIGQISTADAGAAVAANQQVDVTPFVDFNHLSVVQILTKSQPAHCST